MADLLSAVLSVTLAPPGGANQASLAPEIRPEQHAEYVFRKVKVAANAVNFAIPLPDLSTVAFLLLQGSGVFTYRVGTTGATARTCRKFMVETPNNEVISNVYITTGASEVEVTILAVGD